MSSSALFCDLRNFYLRGRRGTFAALLLVGLVVALAACGEAQRPTPTPTATPAAAAMETPTPPAADEALPTSVEVPTQPAGPPATPTVSVLTVDRKEERCAIDYDMDLAGFPDLYARLGCPIGPSSHEPVAINEFGEGPDYNRFMLWFSSDQQIYVLFADQTWQSYRDTWDESQPEFSCNPLDGPPTSPPLPRRGFGKLWCSVEILQKQLGFIEREERLCQHSIVQNFERGRMLACFEDATIRYFSLLNNGSWELLVVR
ncbi:MAG: hypothetical protein NZ553_07630 [Caldilinea sp.]|nr:hypothetical protein [Caldilinea sp.]MDW8440326.1 hypothetical protein [Caldilineaceae bacterium]